MFIFLALLNYLTILLLALRNKHYSIVEGGNILLLNKGKKNTAIYYFSSVFCQKHTYKYRNIKSQKLQNGFSLEFPKWLLLGLRKMRNFTHDCVRVLKITENMELFVKVHPQLAQEQVIKALGPQSIKALKVNLRHKISQCVVRLVYFAE